MLNLVLLPPPSLLKVLLRRVTEKDTRPFVFLEVSSCGPMRIYHHRRHVWKLFCVFRYFVDRKVDMQFWRLLIITLRRSNLSRLKQEKHHRMLSTALVIALAIILHSESTALFMQYIHGFDLTLGKFNGTSRYPNLPTLVAICFHARFSSQFSSLCAGFRFKMVFLALKYAGFLMHLCQHARHFSVGSSSFFFQMSWQSIKRP